MSHIVADRVVDSTSTTGTGAFTLGAPSLNGYQNIGDVCANGDTIWYSATHRTLDQWEVGVGTYGSGTGALTRTTVLASSNSGSAVNFSAGTKDIVATVPASKISPLYTMSFDSASGFVGFGTSSPTAQVHSVYPGTVQFRGTNTSAGGASSGAFISLYQDDGAVCANGDRLGGVLIGGATNNSSTMVNSAGILAYAAEVWSGSANGTDLIFELCNAGATTRSERMRISNSGTVTINKNAAGTLPTPTAGASLHIGQVDGTISRIVQDSFGSGLGSKFTARTARGTAASPSATQLNDELGSWSGLGYGATGYADGGRADYTAIADGIWTDSSHPTRISFWTTPSGSTTVTEIVRINNSGLTGFGTTNPGARVHAAYAGTIQFRGTNSSASGASSGAFMGLYEDDGAVMASGDRLGGVFIGGANDTSSTLINSVAIVGFATETFSGSAAGSALAFEVAASGSLTRTERLRINMDGQIIAFPGSTTPATLGTNGQWTLTPTSNTNFRISYRGSDGSTRTGDITLS